MNTFSSRLATGLLIIAAVALMPSRSWGVFYLLALSSDDWKVKFDVKVSAADGDTLNIALTVVDEGRLKPIHSITVVAFSRQTDSQGGRSYDVKAPFELKPTDDGLQAGQVQIGKEFADRAMIRILTLNVDGKRQTAGAAYYDIPLSRFMK